MKSILEYSNISFKNIYLLLVVIIGLTTLAIYSIYIMFNFSVVAGNISMNNDDPDGNIRYMGANPNNYVTFNNGLWRIMGVFDVKSTESGATEKRLKIIGNESLGNMKRDSNNSNNWTTALLNTYLNETYYNTIDSTPKALISNTYWNLGETALYTIISNELVSRFYGYGKMHNST